MTAPRYARLAARLLARVDSGDPDPPAAGRAAGIAAVEAALHARRRRRSLGRLGLALAATAAVLAVAGGTWRSWRAPEAPVAVTAWPEGHGAVVLAGDATTPLSGARPLGLGERVIARRGGRATLELSTGTRLSLAPNADLEVLEEGAVQRFALAAGEMRAEVAKLAPGQRFLVQTPTSEIEVRGTSFQVTVLGAPPADAAGPRTAVQVFEGVVTVREGGREVQLRSGECWPETCAPARQESAVPPPPASAAPSADPALPKAPRRGPPARSAPRPGPAFSGPSGREDATATALRAPPLEGSRLAAQNDLLEAAQAARREGDQRGALALYDRLLKRYPDGPLAESAEVERMALLADLDPEGARASARRYLAAHPDGFARGRAEAIIAGP